MKQWKRVLGIVLAWCALSSVCAMGAESTVEKRDQESWKGTETKLMASHIAVDTTVTKYGVSWYQPKEYVSYRIWVDNTTNNSMRVTITDPQGRLRTFSVTAHGNKSYVGNGVESGTYRLSFSSSNGGRHKVSVPSGSSTYTAQAPSSWPYVSSNGLLYGVYFHFTAVRPGGSSQAYTFYNDLFG